MPDVLDEIFKVITTFTEEAEQAALATCRDKSFNTAPGQVSLEESFINLSSARDILIDAIENRKLIQLPITIQTVLLKTTNEISRALTSLSGGTDEVQNLVKAIEELSVAIWQFRLHDLSPEVLGFQTKMNQLKSQELEASKLRRELGAGLQSKAKLEDQRVAAEKTMSQLEDVFAVAQSRAGEIANHSTKSAEASTAIQAVLDSSNSKLTAICDAADKKLTDQLAAAAQKAATAQAGLEKSEDQSKQLLAATRASNAEILALEPKIREFFGELGSSRQALVEVREHAEATVTANQEKSEKLMAASQEQMEKIATDGRESIQAIVAKLAKLDEQIGDQIRKATGFSLFHSFQTRQEALKKSTSFWVKALALSLFLSVALTCYLIFELRTAPVNGLFFLKLSASIPIYYAVGFCTVQYGRERRLEEEYAFKANISISLDPYQQLVQKIVNNDNAIEREKYTSFIIDSIGRVFTSPTEKIFEGAEKSKGTNVKMLKQSAEVLGAFAKEVKH